MSKKKKNRAPGWHGSGRGSKSTGRKKNIPNLKHTAEGYVNQHGVEITTEEKKQLERAVARANYLRKKQLKAEAELPRMVAGRDTGDKIGSLQLMGRESDFIITQKSKSLQRFRTRKEFDYYMEHLERINDPNYMANKIRAYKRSHMTAIKNAFGHEADDVIMKIRMMKHEDYIKLIQSDEDLDISYLYDPSAMSGKLNQIRASLGMKLKPTQIPDV